MKTAYSGAFVAPMMRRALAKAEATQLAAWRENHTHCPHDHADSAAILCDHAEAYASDGAEVARVQQLLAWRASTPRVRHDDTRVERDHYFALGRAVGAA